MSNTLSEIKNKAYEESETQLDDAQALDALVSCFRTSGIHRTTARKTKHVNHILAPCVSVWCWARLSIDHLVRMVAKSNRSCLQLHI